MGTEKRRPGARQLSSLVGPASLGVTRSGPADPSLRDAFAATCHIRLDRRLPVPMSRRGRPGRIDPQINPAGPTGLRPFARRPPAVSVCMIPFSPTVAKCLARAVLPATTARGDGRTVHIGSILGGIGLVRCTAHSSGRSGLCGHSEAPRRDLDGNAVGAGHGAPRGEDGARPRRGVSHRGDRTGTSTPRSGSHDGSPRRSDAMPGSTTAILRRGSSRARSVRCHAPLPADCAAGSLLWDASHVTAGPGLSGPGTRMILGGAD